MDEGAREMFQKMGAAGRNPQLEHHAFGRGRAAPARAA